MPTFLFDLVEAAGPLSRPHRAPSLTPDEQAAYERALAEGREIEFIAEFIGPRLPPFPELPDPTRP